MIIVKLHFLNIFPQKPLIVRLYYNNQKSKIFYAQNGEEKCQLIVEYRSLTSWLYPREYAAKAIDIFQAKV